MNNNADKPDDWSDVLFVDGEEKTVSYRTAMVVYEESLIKEARRNGRGGVGTQEAFFASSRGLSLTG